MSKIACFVGLNTENRTMTCSPSSITRLTPARTRSPEVESSPTCSPYKVGNGALSCCSRSLSKLEFRPSFEGRSAEAGLGLSEPADDMLAGVEDLKRARASSGADPLPCVKGTVAPTKAKGN